MLQRVPKHHGPPGRVLAGEFVRAELLEAATSFRPGQAGRVRAKACEDHGQLGLCRVGWIAEQTRTLSIRIVHNREFARRVMLMTTEDASICFRSVVLHQHWTMSKACRTIG